MQFHSTPVHNFISFRLLNLMLILTAILLCGSEADIYLSDHDRF